MARRQPSTDVARRRDQLTVDQEAAAAFASQGLTGSALAKETGMPLATIRRWEALPAFTDRRNQLVEQNHFAISAQFQSTQEVVLRGRAAAAAKLIEMMEAEDDEGRPIRDTQIRAAEIMMKVPVVDTLSQVLISKAKGAAAAEVNEAKPTGHATIVIAVDKSGHAEAAPGLTVVDGEVVDAEVVDDPPGAPPV